MTSADGGVFGPKMACMLRAKRDLVENAATNGQPGAGQPLVAVGAKLLLDLLEDINHG